MSGPAPTDRAALRRWGLRAAQIAAAYVAVLVPLVLFDFDPDPVRLVLVVGICLLALWTVSDGVLDSPSAWWVERVNEVAPRGADARLGRYARMVEDHLAAGEPSDAVRLQVARLATAALRQHHGLGLDDPGATTLLGDEVAGWLRVPGHRFTVAQLDRVADAVDALATTQPVPPTRGPR